MSKNNYWVLLLKGEEPKLFASWPESGEKMLIQAAGQYIYELREKMEITVMSIEGVSHTAAQGPGIALADKLARKGAGIVD